MQLVSPFHIADEHMLPRAMTVVGILEFPTEEAMILTTEN